jgi:hypothetical protein
VLKLNETIKKPKGLNIVRWATLLLSLVLGFYIYGAIIASAGLTHEQISLSLGAWLFVFMAVFSFIISLLLFSSNVSYIWYLSNVYWITLTIFFVYMGNVWEVAQGLWDRTTYFFYCIPFVYSISCIVYFQNRRIKQYFKMVK